MLTTFLMFHLWITPIVTDDGVFGTKLTMQLTDAVYLKLRIYDPGFDPSSLDQDRTTNPTAVARIEIDF